MYYIYVRTTIKRISKRKGKKGEIMAQVKDERVKEAFEKIQEGVKQVFTSENYTNYLKFLSKFYNYSSNNCLLILDQFPEASMVASMGFWGRAKRSVKKGEKAITILAPVNHHYIKKNEDGEDEIIDYVTFKTAFVFDVSQTEGNPIPSIVKELKGTNEEIQTLIHKMENILNEFHIKLEYWNLKGTAKGFYRSSDDLIVIKKGLEDLQILKTLIHEVAHYLCHKYDETSERARKELEAESIAYTVLNYFGIDSSEYSFGYLASWSTKEPKELNSILNGIQKQTKFIINKLQEEE